MVLINSFRGPKAERLSFSRLARRGGFKKGLTVGFVTIGVYTTNKTRDVLPKSLPDVCFLRGLCKLGKQSSFFNKTLIFPF